MVHIIVYTKEEYLFQYQSSIIPRTGELIHYLPHDMYKVIQVTHPITFLNYQNKIKIQVEKL